MTAPVVTSAPAPTPTKHRRPITAFTSAWASQIGITTAFVLLWIAFIVLAPDTFLHAAIYRSFAETTPFFALMAMPLTMIIVTGDMDLSFPSVMALGMVGFVGVWQPTGSVVLGVLAALATGALAGLFNGLVVTQIGIPSLVVTIGTQFLFRGLALVLVGGKQYPLVDTLDHPLHQLFVGQVFGLPMEFPWLILVSIGAWLLLNRHRLGQNAYVVGDNRQAAALMGIPITRTRIMLFVLAGLVAAFAGILNSFQVVNFYPSMGDGYLLPTLAAVFVGGTSVFGGRGSVWGTFIGAFMIGGITAGIVAVGLTDYYTNLIYGAVILVSVSIHALLQRRFQ
jgi:simple sugar transport system permease protein